jgi:putative ABC transport system ATP-binding protein
MVDPGTLSIEGVWKGYSRGSQWTEVLANVSLDVQPGEVVAVEGGRFRGKTTLLKIAAGLERPDKGSVSLGACRLTDCRDAKQSHLLGYQIRWIDCHGPKMKVDVAKFVGLPQALHGRKRRQAERAAGQALERVGAQQCLGRRWGELSDWQRLLVSLARAFVGSPSIVVIDGLLDGLGGHGTEEASDLLRSLIETSEPRCGVLISASSTESAMYADQVWSITGKRRLKLMSAPRMGGNVIPFPDRDNLEVGG